MQTLRDIKRRIKVVQNIEHITRAMKMISAAKLQKAQRQVQEARPYARKIREILRDLEAQQGEFEHPLLKERPVRRACYVVLTADQGLCGGYNTNVLHEAAFAVGQDEAEVEVITVGAKARRFFHELGYPLAATYPSCPDKVTFLTVRPLADRVSSDFTAGRYDAVYFVYTRFYSAVTQKPVVRRVLPVETEEVEGPIAYRSIYQLEPNEEEVLNRLLPRYVSATIYRIFLEAKAAEHGARVTAMDAATDNAEELLGQLTLSYNRARQAAITEELTEIIAGADALKEEVGLRGE
ncbi:MAG TPA: ATP synthase F1 subunit gamma [Firmicutes bacterium]|uniref:ATP synthase F1 subunit gamma n=1 Tax=Gelria sp. Kuro-4 TaxID=2796927 RepID=UPI00199DA17C|nr:ATP synthase F1 subunit gamma [Gelria sp. Kuro-4]MDI3521928.1 F-type H+-transporting ATPase subunit gamma [Bacillota bacterium]MDK2928131.1 F-type H+-transporting ATPase subunit gamma [Bacillota bacterium]BCV25385.1 ATP synthase subunit gamma [Gelria sp. Kuro-4]HHV58485.1 ATP synthase F1 subunit gamma [Bacillota bacterium]